MVSLVDNIFLRPHTSARAHNHTHRETDRQTIRQPSIASVSTRAICKFSEIIKLDSADCACKRNAHNNEQYRACGDRANPNVFGIGLSQTSSIPTHTGCVWKPIELDLKWLRSNRIKTLKSRESDSWVWARVCARVGVHVCACVYRCVYRCVYIGVYSKNTANIQQQTAKIQAGRHRWQPHRNTNVTAERQPCTRSNGRERLSSAVLAAPLPVRKRGHLAQNVAREVM